MSDRDDALPSYVVHRDDVEEVEGSNPAPYDAEKLTLYRDVARAAGSTRVGFAIERLLPGRRSSFTHAHLHEEELVYVVSGRCHLRVVEPGKEAREIPLRAGHFVAFPPGTGIAHTFVNHGEQECTLIVVGERHPEERVFYAEDLEYDAYFARVRPETYWKREDR